jgi:hypothetical protein
MTGPIYSIPEAVRSGEQKVKAIFIVVEIKGKRGKPAEIRS